MELMNLHNEGAVIKDILNNTEFEDIKLHRDKVYIIIGSGLSNVIAEYLAFFLMKIVGINAQVYTPLEYIVMRPIGFPVIVSYRGKNRDIIGVTKTMIDTLIPECIMITGNKGSTCSNMLFSHNVKVSGAYLPPHTDERRFVSIRSTISLVGLSWQLCENLISSSCSKLSTNEVDDIISKSEIQAEQITKKIFSIPNYTSKKWIVLGIGMHDPLSKLVQSCFAEAGLLSVQIGDYRDYLHGKYLAAFEEANNAFFLIKYPQCSKMREVIHKRFQPYFSLVEINTSRNSITECIEEILTIFLVVEKLLAKKGFSLRTPPKPTEMRNWTSWGDLCE